MFCARRFVSRVLIHSTCRDYGSDESERDRDCYDPAWTIEITMGVTNSAVFCTWVLPILLDLLSSLMTPLRFALNWLLNNGLPLNVSLLSPTSWTRVHLGNSNHLWVGSNFVVYLEVCFRFLPECLPEDKYWVDVQDGTVQVQPATSHLVCGVAERTNSGQHTKR